MADQPHVTCAADVHALLGEGPVWVEREQALYWVDIKGRKIFRLGEDGTLRSWDTPMRVGSLAPRTAGGFVAGPTGAGICRSCCHRFEIFANPDEDRPDNRFNDGKVDRQGRFWAGTMDDREREATGTLYRLDPDLRVTTADQGYRVTNGPAFGPDGRIMYHNDSARQVTYAFDLDASGNVANRREFLCFGEATAFPTA